MLSESYLWRAGICMLAYISTTVSQGSLLSQCQLTHISYECSVVGLVSEGDHLSNDLTPFVETS